MFYNPPMPDRTPDGRGQRGRTLLALAVLAVLPAAHTLLAASGDDVVDTVDVEVAGRDTVLGTLRPPEERETFLIALPRGAKLKASAKGTSDGAPQPVLDVTDPQGAVIASSSPAKTAKTPQVVVAESGMHRVLVCGDGVLDGDYRLKVRASMPRSASETSATDVAPGAEATFAFGAAGGTTAKITLSAARRSDLRPTILEITGPDDLTIPVEPPPAPGKRHTVRDVALPTTGDYTVRFRNDGAAPGGWKAKARLKSDKPAKLTIEITDEVLAGEFAGEQAVFARSIGDAGGVVAPQGDGTLTDVSVDVPAGAVSEPTLFTISEADPFFVDDDTFEGGSTFELGPSGIDFSEDVTVTVPYDPQAYDDPGTEVEVAIRDGETGEVEVVPGTVDPVAETVSFQTSHFSGFQPVSPRQRPLRGGFVELEIGGRIDPQLGGTLLLGLNAIVGQDGPRTGNGVARNLDRRFIGFGPDGQGGVVFAVDRDQALQSGTVRADADLALQLGSQIVTFLRGRTPDALVRGGVANDQANVAVLLRRVKGRATQGALRGDWFGIVLEIAGERGSAGGLVVTTTGRRFELEVDADGRAVASDSDLWTTRVPYPGGEPTSSRSRRAPRPGTLRPSGSFGRLTMDVGVADGPAFVDLHAVARGDLLVGVTGDVQGLPTNPSRAMARLVLLARAGRKGSDADLSGRSRFVAFDAGFETASTAQVPVPVLDLLSLDVQHDGAGSLRARGGTLRVRHGPAGQPVISTGQIDVDGTYSVEKDLEYRPSTPLGPGVLLRRRGLYISTFFGPERIALGFGLPARPLPE